jgi:hypothetical protein
MLTRLTQSEDVGRNATLSVLEPGRSAIVVKISALPQVSLCRRLRDCAPARVVQSVGAVVLFPRMDRPVSLEPS